MGLQKDMTEHTHIQSPYLGLYSRLFVILVFHILPTFALSALPIFQSTELILFSKHASWPMPFLPPETAFTQSYVLKSYLRL